MTHWRAGCLVLVLMFAATHAAAAEKIFRLGLNGLPPSKGNPYTTTASTPYLFWTALFDALTVIDNMGQLHPALATEWRPVNQTTWIFKLRPNVTFSNGEPFDASAVKAAFDYLMSDEGATQSMAREVNFISGVRVIDPLTVEIATASPNILLPRYLASIQMVAPAQFERLGADGFANAPIGTGPFKVENWQAEKVTLAAFKESWRAPRIDRLEIMALPDATARVQALESGQVDVATNINPDHTTRLTAAGNRFHMRNPTRSMVFAFDTIKEGSPFKDVRVRQAMNLAVNRQAIADSLLNGLAEPASQPVPPVALGYDVALRPYPYDPPQAQRLLKEAGYPDGFAFVMEFPGGQIASDTAIAQQVASDLALVGVRMEIRNIPLPQVIRNMAQGGWKGLAFETDFNVAPSLDGLRPFRLHSCAWSAPWFCDRAIEPVIAEALATFDLERRTELTRQVIRYYRDAAESLFLFPSISLDGLGPRVSTWEPWNDNLRYELIDLK